MPSVYAAHVLITEEEAKLPPPKGAVATDRRGMTRGPKIKFVDESEPVHSPMHLQVMFESFGGAKIDPDSVKVTYLKNPNVDLTPRIKPFVQSAGIDIPDVELPVGRTYGQDRRQGFGRPDRQYERCSEGRPVTAMPIACPFCLQENAPAPPLFAPAARATSPCRPRCSPSGTICVESAMRRGRNCRAPGASSKSSSASRNID